VSPTSISLCVCLVSPTNQPASQPETSGISSCCWRHRSSSWIGQWDHFPLVSTPSANLGLCHAASIPISEALFRPVPSCLLAPVCPSWVSRPILAINTFAPSHGAAAVGYICHRIDGVARHALADRKDTLSHLAHLAKKRHGQWRAAGV
jgi:hypothetical protein